MERSVALRERVRRLNGVRATLRERVQEARQGEDDDIVFGQDDPRPRSDDVVSAPIRAAAEWAWRILVIGALVVIVAMVLWDLRVIVFPIIAALFLSALLQPAVRVLRRIGLPRGLAAGIVLIGGLAIIVGIFTALANVLTSELGDISLRAQDGVDEIKNWAADGPLNLSDAQVNQYVQQATDYVTTNQGALAGGVIASATAALEIFSGTLLALFATLFFLYDGERIWAWIARLFPRQAERPVLEAGNRAWTVLVSYVRATIFIAAVDGIGIGIVLAVVGVPLAVPLGALVFFGAFVPIVGATVTGAVAVLVALVTNGPVAALIVLAGVIAIQQLEGHILQPLIMGRFIKIHPLAVVLAVATGALVAGIIGTIIAVPLAAILKTVLSYFSSLQRGQVPAPALAGDSVGVPDIADGDRSQRLATASPAADPADDDRAVPVDRDANQAPTSAPGHAD